MKVGRKKRRVRKKVETPKLDFDMEAIKEIKKRKKRSKKRTLRHLIGR